MEFSHLFEELKSIMQPYAMNLDCKKDEPGNYYLDTKFIMENKKPLYFGGVRINKNYVSYHLMPIYVNPELLKSISSDLKKRMQGKSCFNFKAIDRKLFKELDNLTQAAFNYIAKEYVQRKY